MKNGLKKKMEVFFDSISDHERSKNKKLNRQILFLKKYLKNLGDFENENQNNDLIQKYFKIQFGNQLTQGM